MIGGHISYLRILRIYLYIDILEGVGDWMPPVEHEGPYPFIRVKNRGTIIPLKN